MGSKDQLFLLKLEACDDPKERTDIIHGYLESLNAANASKVVPDFPKQCEWLNCKAPLSFQRELRGKIVVLDFFTYCCINCMHVLPDLHAVEAQHSVEDGLIVIGVHSAKFENEKVSANIQNAVLRYGITHHVINDSEATMWNDMEIACWPTLVIVGPAGQHLLSLVGEGHRQTLLEFSSAVLKWYKSLDQISHHVINVSLEQDGLLQSKLLFPGKISVNQSCDRLAISDTGHNRILIVNTDGRVETTIGRGTNSGFVDGSFEEAMFHGPQGVVWKGETTLFVADTENHAIRMIDMRTRMVSTVAGTGQQGNDKTGGKAGHKQAISSPWDVVIGPAPGSLNPLEDDSVLYIAMAGTHQIWGLCLSNTRWIKGSEQEAWTCLRFSGSGAEENRNNSYPHKSGYAQPSGLSIARAKPLECLFIADSESSSVRAVSITSGGSKAVAGADRDPMNLFAFGDLDGKGVEAKLQHPLAVCWNTHRQELFLADSYNHKIKVIDPKTKYCKTILGTGNPGWVDGNNDVQFNEPGGLDLSPDGKILYVADTNSNAIRMIDLSTRFVSTLNIVDNNVSEVREMTDSGNNGTKYSKLAPNTAAVVDCEPVTTLEAQLDLHLSVALPENCKLTEGATSKWQVTLYDATKDIHACQMVKKGELSSLDKPTKVKLELPECPQTQAQAEVKVFFCEPDGACYMKGVILKFPITRSKPNNTNNNNTVTLRYEFVK